MDSCSEGLIIFQGEHELEIDLSFISFIFLLAIYFFFKFTVLVGATMLKINYEAFKCTTVE